MREYSCGGLCHDVHHVLYLSFLLLLEFHDVHVPLLTDDQADEDQTDGIDVAREDGRVAAFDECQPPIVVVDVETARQVAVEVVDEVPLDLVE